MKKHIKKKGTAMLVTRPTVDEQLAASLGYINVLWPDPRIADRDFPRGVWKCPRTGRLHTPLVIRLMQKPVDPKGKPFAVAESLAAAARREAQEKREAIQQENAALLAAAATERKRRALLAALAL